VNHFDPPPGAVEWLEACFAACAKKLHHAPADIVNRRSFALGWLQAASTWGNMLDNAYRYLETAPWLWGFPGLLILLTVLSINFVGDGLRDALDPRTGQRLHG